MDTMDTCGGGGSGEAVDRALKRYSFSFLSPSLLLLVLLFELKCVRCNSLLTLRLQQTSCVTPIEPAITQNILICGVAAAEAVQGRVGCGMKGEAKLTEKDNSKEAPPLLQRSATSATIKRTARSEAMHTKALINFLPNQACVPVNKPKLVDGRLCCIFRCRCRRSRSRGHI